VPTAKPRITITLDPQVHATIERLAQLQGRSRGSVVAELLESAHPPLMRTVALLEAAKDAPDKVKADLRRVIEDLERQLAGESGATLGQMDWMIGRIMESEGENRG
jgi:hypothetical protein